MCAFEQSEKGMDFIMEKNIKSEEKLKKPQKIEARGFDLSGFLD